MDVRSRGNTRSSLGLIAGLLVGLIAGGCGRIEFDPEDRDATASDAGRPDAGSVDAAAMDGGSIDSGGLDAGAMDSGAVDAGPTDAGSLDAGPLTIGPFATVTPIAAVNTGGQEDDPTLTGDELILFFNDNTNVFMSERASTSDAWGPRSTVTELAIGTGQTSPELSSDGLTMFFSSRSGATFNFDIYVATRAARTDPWGVATRVAELSTSGLDTNCAPRPDLLRVVFATGASAGARDIHEATRPSPSDAFGGVTALTPLNTSSEDSGPFLARGGLLIVFSSTRAGGAGGNDLYFSTRASLTAPFDPPTPVAGVNTAADEADPWLTEDGTVLYFTRDNDLQVAHL